MMTGGVSVVLVGFSLPSLSVSWVPVPGIGLASPTLHGTSLACGQVGGTQGGTMTNVLVEQIGLGCGCGWGSVEREGGSVGLGDVRKVVGAVVVIGVAEGRSSERLPQETVTGACCGEGVG